MKNQIKQLKGKPKLLLHCCCAPCASAVLEKLKDFFEITLYYYNPNIMPQNEWEKRKNEFNKLKSICNFDFISEKYDNQDWLGFVAGLENEKEGGLRCEKCISYRLQTTFNFASNKNFDYFCSTLSISPHKNATLINEIGLKLENEKTKWLFNDFKKDDGFLKSIKFCEKLKIYRQNYCGCLL